MHEKIIKMGACFSSKYVKKADYQKHLIQIESLLADLQAVQAALANKTQQNGDDFKLFSSELKETQSTHVSLLRRFGQDSPLSSFNCFPLPRIDLQNIQNFKSIDGYSINSRVRKNKILKNEIGVYSG